MKGLTLHLTEPHPSVPSHKSTAYLHSGRGGAGNYRAHKPSTLTPGPDATGPASRIPLIPRGSQTSTAYSQHPSSTHTQAYPAPAPAHRRSSSSAASHPAADRFVAGRGGAGNVRDVSERAIFSFDEELERLSRAQEQAAPVFHIGRGGSGNFVAGGEYGPGLDRKSSAGSSSSDGSTAERKRGWWGKR
jgi:hypothetical protein